MLCHSSDINDCRLFTTAGAQVRVDVHVTGVCQHVGATVHVERPNRRQLRSTERAEAATLLTSSRDTAHELYVRRMAELSDAELRAANVTAAQTPAVLRQAAYERSRSERLHEDLVLELEVARQCWETSMPGSHVDGFIQQLGLYPFHVVFYTEQQLLAYVHQCKSQSGAVVHVDATGSIVNRIPNQKTPYYYCLLLADGSLPVMEFISCCHEAAWLQSLLLTFNSAVRRVNSGRLVTPRYVVMDFSYTLLHACVQAMNDGMQIVGYLELTFEILRRRCSVAKFRNVTFLTLCVAHMVKVMSTRLTKVEPSRSKRTVAMTYFAALQRSQELQSAAGLYRDIHLVLCSQYESSVVADARLRLQSCVSGVNVDDTEELEGLPDLDQQQPQTCVDVRTIKRRSPFQHFFRSCLTDVEDASGDDVQPLNVTFSPSSFAQVKRRLQYSRYNYSCMT